MTKPRVCVDCRAEGIPTKRPAPNPGPRCASHHRARRAKTRSTAWESRLMKNYGLSADQYHKLHQYQGGRCYICRKGTGRTKRLSVDHDHSTGLVRGLLDQKCNRDVLGHFGDSIEALERAIEYLKNPPAFRVIGQIVAPIESGIGVDIPHTKEGT